MSKLLALIKRYRFFLVVLAINSVLLFVAPDVGKESFGNAFGNLREMLSVIPPIFILLGLLDVWVDRETMIKLMGEGSGFRGGLIAFILGSAAAGPLYAAFPLAAVMLKKRAKLLNVFIFIGAWSTTKIPLLLFESSSLGFRYMLLRLAFNVVGIILIAFILERTTSSQEKQEIYDRAESL